MLSFDWFSTSPCTSPEVVQDMPIDKPFSTSLWSKLQPRIVILNTDKLMIAHTTYISVYVLNNNTTDGTISAIP